MLRSDLAGLRDHVLELDSIGEPLWSHDITRFVKDTRTWRRRELLKLADAAAHHGFEWPATISAERILRILDAEEPTTTFEKWRLKVRRWFRG